jgi:hypothetical protein
MSLQVYIDFDSNVGVKAPARLANGLLVEDAAMHATLSPFKTLSRLRFDSIPTPCNTRSVAVEALMS